MRLAAPHSLRARLLWFLSVAIVLAAAAQALIAYRTARAEADTIFDYHMQQMAMALRPGLPLGARPNESADAPRDEDDDFVLQVWTADGVNVFQTARLPLPLHTRLGFTDVQSHGTTYRVFSMRAGQQIIQVAQDMAARREMASTLAWRTLLPILLMAPLLMLLVWWLVSTSLAPVARVKRQVAGRAANDLNAISEAGLPDEIRPLVYELNLLFARVRQAFDAQKSFVADAAHELRSPLAALKLQVQGLQRAGDGTARDLAIARLSAGIDRATRLVEQLLVLARQEAGATSGLQPEVMDLDEVVREAIAEAAPQAIARRIDLGLTRADPARLRGHPDALHMLVRNLLDNAVKYTPDGGTVDVTVHAGATGLWLTVEDSGPGIPEADHRRVFDRFYRLSGAAATGSGLGLAIVKSIADLHGAQIMLETSARLGGLKLSVIFPNLYGPA